MSNHKSASLSSCTADEPKKKKVHKTKYLEIKTEALESSVRSYIKIRNTGLLTLEDLLMREGKTTFLTVIEVK